MSIEEYINKRKKEDEMNEFHLEKRVENFKLIIDYSFEYFNGYLNRSDIEKENEEKSIKVQRYRDSLEFYSEDVQDWLVELYKTKKVKLNFAVQRRLKDPIFPLYTEESEFNKLSYSLYASLNKKYPFLIEHMDIFKQYLKEYHNYINYGTEYEETYKLANSSEINNWVKYTKEKYNINLQAFAEYYSNLYSIMPKWWDRIRYIDKENKTGEWYDIANSKDIFSISTLYPKLKDKPFIKGKKKELIILILMYYKENIDKVPTFIIDKYLPEND